MKKFGVILSLFAVFTVFLTGCGDPSGSTDSGKYTVTFDTNGGSPVPAALTDVDKGTKIDKPTDPAKGAFTFKGWYNNKTFSGSAWNFDSDTVSGNTTLYANYTKDKPDVDPNDDKIINYFSVTFIDDDKVLSSYEVGYGEKIIAPASPVRSGFYFDGWYKGEEGTAAKWLFTTGTVTEDTTLYSKYTAVTSAPYIVRFSNEGKLHYRITGVAEGAKITKPAETPEKEDYTFVAWYKEEEFLNEWNFATDTVTRNLVLYAGFKPVIDEPPEDTARAEKVTLANAWYVVYYFELPSGKTVSDYKDLKASYTLTTTELKNAVARGARLMGPYPKEFFRLVMGAATGSAPGIGVAVASYNLNGNAPYILDNTWAWGKVGGAGGADEGKGTLKDLLAQDALGYTPSPNDWFDLSYSIDGSKKHADYGKQDVVFAPSIGPLFYGLGLPGQGPSSDQAAYPNTFYIRDVKLEGNQGTDDVIGRPVYFVKDGYKYPAYTGYENTNGSAGHKEASRESCDNLNPPIEIPVTW